MTNTREDITTPSTGGSYRHTYECDVFTLGSAVMVLLEADMELTLENLHRASFGSRDAFPHRVCYHNCAGLRLGQIETELERARKRERATRPTTALNTSPERAALVEQVAALVAERAAIRAEIDA